MRTKSAADDSLTGDVGGKREERRGEERREEKRRGEEFKAPHGWFNGSGS